MDGIRHANVPCGKAPKRLKLDDDVNEETGSTGDATWVKYENHSLSFEDLTILLSGRNLSDKHINLAQKLIKSSIPILWG